MQPKKTTRALFAATVATMALGGGQNALAQDEGGEKQDTASYWYYEGVPFLCADTPVSGIEVMPLAEDSTVPAQLQFGSEANKEIEDNYGYNPFYSNDQGKRMGCINSLVERMGYIDIRSVGDYSSQEGSLPDKNGKAHLSWEVSERSLYSSSSHRTLPEYGGSPGRPSRHHAADGITWVFVPKELENISIKKATDEDDKNTLKIKHGVPKTLDDFNDATDDADEDNNPVAWMIGVEELREGLFSDIGLSQEDDNYQAIAIPNTVQGDILVSGDIDVSKADSDVYVPARATNRISVIMKDYAKEYPWGSDIVTKDNYKKVISTGKFNWATMEGLPQFSVTDSSINQKHAENYQHPHNQIAGLVGSDKCKVTKTAENTWEVLRDVDNPTRLVPDSEMEEFRDFAVPFVSEGLKTKGVHLHKNQSQYYHEDGCDQSAHRILVDSQPEEIPETSEPTPTPSPSPDPQDPPEDPQPSSIPSTSTPTPSTSTSTPTPQPNPSVPSASATPTTQENSSFASTSTAQHKTKQEPTPTSASTSIQPGSSTSMRTTPPRIVKGSSDVKDYPVATTKAPIAAEQVPGQYPSESEIHPGPVVNTGGSSSLSLWQKVTQVFR